MILTPGCTFVVAPKFQLKQDWEQRLAIGAGVHQSPDGFHPRDDWRAPTSDELSLLTRTLAPAPSDGPDSPRDCISLFQLPEHLGDQWWNLLESSGQSLGRGELPGFESFATAIAELLEFKGLVLPDDVGFNVVAQSGAIALNACRLWGAINLGDQDISLVLMNLTLPRIAEALARQRPSELLSSSDSELAARFLGSCADYPPVRLTVRPGEGYCLPEGGMIIGGLPGAEGDPQVVLQISRGTSIGGKSIGGAAQR